MEQYDLERMIQRFETSHFRVERRLHALFKQCIGEALTLDQFMVLRYIGKRGSVTSTEIAEWFCVGKSSVTSLMNRLVVRQYVMRTQDPTDRRILYLSLTEKGMEMKDKLDAKIKELIASFLIHFTQEEAETFLTSLEKLSNLIERTEGVE